MERKYIDATKCYEKAEFALEEDLRIHYCHCSL